MTQVIYIEDTDNMIYVYIDNQYVVSDYCNKDLRWTVERLVKALVPEATFEDYYWDRDNVATDLEDEPVTLTPEFLGLLTK